MAGPATALLPNRQGSLTPRDLDLVAERGSPSRNIGIGQTV